MTLSLMTTSEMRAVGGQGRDFGSGPGCPVCDAGAVGGDLCTTHRAMFDRDIPTPLVKALPPKERVVNEDCW